MKIGSVNIKGGGADAWFAALVVKRLLPKLEVAVRITGEGIPGGETTTPYLTRQLLGALGIRPIDLHRLARPTWSLGFRCRWGHRDEFLRAFDLQLTQKAGGLTREPGFVAAREGMEHASFGQALMQARRIPGIDPKQGSGAVDAMAGLQLRADRFSELLQKACRAVGVIEGDMEAGLTISTSGPVEGEFLQAAVFCPKIVSGSRPRASEALRPYAGIESHASGWWHRVEHADRVELAYHFDPEFIGETEARELLAERLGDSAGEISTREIRCGRLAEPWSEAGLAVGDAAGAFEPFSAMRMSLLYHELHTFCRLLAEVKGDAGPACRELYHAAISRARTEIGDFATLHYQHSGRDEPFWSRAREHVGYEALGPMIQLYRKSGPSGYLSNAIPGYPGTLGHESWIAALVGLGVPFEAGAEVSGEEVGRWRALAAEHARKTKQAVDPERALTAARGG